MGGSSLSHPTSLFQIELPTTFATQTRRKRDAAWWLSLDHDLRLIRGTQVSVMMVGPDQVLEELIRRATTGFEPPGIVQCQNQQLSLPASSSDARGVWFRDIDALSAPEQRQLLRWLESDRPGPVFSTATRPVFPLVQAGFFNETLLYRLNAVYIDLSDFDPAPFRM